MTPSSRPRRCLVFALLLAASTLPASAATLTVTSPLESGAGTLRQALFDADPGDTIVFDLPFPAVLHVSIGAYTLDTPVTIVGPGADDLVLDASGNAQSTFIVPPGGSAEISRLTLRNSSAGAVRNGGTLTMRDMVFEDNRTPIGGGSGGAILNTGVLAVSDSHFRGNSGSSSAGALFSNGSATIERCSFIDNDSPDGGAIVNDGTMTVARARFPVTSPSSCTAVPAAPSATTRRWN